MADTSTSTPPVSRLGKVYQFLFGDTSRNMFVISVLIIGGIIAAVYFFPAIASLQYVMYALFGIVGIFLLIYSIQNIERKDSIKSGISPTTFFKLMYYFLPYGIISFTTLSDAFNAKFKYTTGTLTAIIAVLLNYMLTKLFTTPRDPVTNLKIPVVDNNYCGIPGFGFLGSNILPQGMLFNLTAIAHIATQIMFETNFDTKYVVPSSILFGAVFIVSTAMNLFNKCFEIAGTPKFVIQNITPNNKSLGVLLTVVLTLLISVGAGALGGWLTSQNLEGFAGHIEPPKKDEADKNVNICEGDKCSADEQGQFVAEIYQNGKIIGTSAQ